MVPLRTVVSVTTVLAPYVIPRYNLSVAGPINGQAAANGSSGAAIAAVERVAAETLPAGYGFEWSGLSYQETQSAGQAPVRSEEHTSELQSLMRISYAVFCLQKKHTHTYF